jgi:hypothetical protein
MYKATEPARVILIPARVFSVANQLEPGTTTIWLLSCLDDLLLSAALFYFGLIVGCTICINVVIFVLRIKCFVVLFSCVVFIIFVILFFKKTKNTIVFMLCTTECDKIAKQLSYELKFVVLYILYESNRFEYQAGSKGERIFCSYY